MQDIGMLTELLILLLVIAALLIIYYYTRVYRKPYKEKNSYLSALEYLADGQEKWAIQKFKEAVRDDTENISAYLRLGDLLRKKAMTSNALKIHKDLMQRPNLSQDMKSKIQNSLMLDYEAVGKIGSAIEVAKALLEKDKGENTEIASRLLKYLENEEKWQEAYHAVRKYFRKLPNQMKKRAALYLVFEGLHLEENDKGKEARLKFREAKKTDPECSAAYYYLGKSYHNENRLQEAIQEWQNLNNNVPQKAHAVFDELEKTWFDLGKFAEVEKFYKNILIKDPENIYAAMALAEIYNKKEEFDNALGVLEKVMANRADDLSILAFKIQILWNKSQYKQASSEAIAFINKSNHINGWNFSCLECQFDSKEPLWICPQCKSIASFEI